MDSLKLTILEGDVKMYEREKIFDFLTIISETDKKKKKKWYFLDDEMEEENEDIYYDDFYEIIRYPPNSNPPTMSNTMPLKSHPMISLKM